MGRNKEFDTTLVLHKAIEVFGEYGYDGTSLQELLAKLGIARQSLYDTYGTKRELFLSALKSYIKQKTVDVIALLEAPGSVKEAITRIFHEGMKVLLEDSERSRQCFIVNSAVELMPADQEIAEILSSNTAELEQAFYKALVRAEAQGELNQKHDDLMTLARYLNHSRLSLTFHAKNVSGPEVLKDIVKVTLSVLDN